MAEDHRRRINLDDHQPDDAVLTFKGVDYDIPGEIPVPTIVAMVRFQAKVEAAKASGDMQAIGDELEAMVDRIMELIRERKPGAETLPLTVSHVTAIIVGLINTEGVEDTVRDALEDEQVEEPDEVPVPLAQAS